MLPGWRGKKADLSACLTLAPLQASLRAPDVAYQVER